jgi:hypothetical protein
MAKPGPKKVDEKTAKEKREAAKNETLIHLAKHGDNPQKAKDAIKDNAKGGKE